MTDAKKPYHVLVLHGSPRKKGNSKVLAEQIKKGAEAGGAKVETIYLNGMNIKPCQACYACQEEDSKASLHSAHGGRQKGGRHVRGSGL